MNSGLEGRRILITGASGGIGAATARAFADAGARPALHYGRNRAAAEALAEEIGGAAPVLGADLRDEAAVDAAFGEAIRALGGLDALVVNAGIWPPEDVPLQRMSLARWRRTLDVDLTGAFLCCRAFLRHLAAAPRDEASIVLVGSTAAVFGEAGHADYAAAKAGLTYGLLRSLKNEIVALAPRGRVNAVCPGWTDTPMAAGQTDDPAALARVTATMPLKKIARPEDVAASIVFLSAPGWTGHVSGQVLTVAGGMEGRWLRGESPPV